jgi:hypothetical protein
MDFPANPTLNQIYTFNGRTWQWNGIGWQIVAGSLSFPDGTAAAPGVAFTSDIDTGFRRTGSGAVAVVSDGVDHVQFLKHGGTPATSAVLTIPTKFIPEWASGTYSGNWGITTFLNSAGTLTGGIIYYGEKYTEVLSNYGRVIGGNTYVDYLGIGEGESGGAINYPHYIYFDTSRPDGNGTRRRMQFDQNGLLRTNYHDYPGLASNVNSSTLGPAFFCRAWVNFNGTGTVAIRASGNVSSISDLGVGYYRANFATSLPLDGAVTTGADAYAVGSVFTPNYAEVYTYNASNSGLEDTSYISAAIFR